MKALEIRNLKKTYGKDMQALKGISLDVEEGDFFALLGPNGAGKSTAIGIITSLVNKTSGSIKVFGHDIDDDFNAAKACIGVVPQEFNVNIFEKVWSIVVNQAGFYGLPRKLAQERAEYYLRALDLWDKRNARSRELSGGMKRRLMIARALVHKPKLLILDEPTAGVDIEIRRSMWKFIRDINEQGTTVILTTHYLEEAENLCRNIAIINHGELIENTSMRSLLQTLDTETFVLYSDETIVTPPSIPGVALRAIDDNTLEVDIPKDAPMNDVFTQLSQNNIQITSMRNKTNRLEELFLNLVGKPFEDEANNAKRD